jgi:hypothetical protein
MLFCLQWETGPSRMQTGFSFVQIHRSDTTPHVYTFQILQSAKCTDFLYPSGSSVNFLKSQLHSPFNLSVCNPETFSFSTTTSVMSMWLQILYWQINLQSHKSNDQHGVVRYLLALLKFDELCLM